MTAEFKTKVVLEAIKEQSSLAELESKYNVAGSQISTWKGKFLKNAHLAFGHPVSVENAAEMENQKLYAKIGQLQTENEFLKKVLARLKLQNDKTS